MRQLFLNLGKSVNKLQIIVKAYNQNFSGKFLMYTSTKILSNQAYGVLTLKVDDLLFSAQVIWLLLDINVNKFHITVKIGK